ncbi:MAG: hypothetical protein DMF82_03020 [Acidobacteria bacterium]|nr:MAG: hypothetical protein DMF82_03020 [Acidobacteriota bacterium]
MRGIRSNSKTWVSSWVMRPCSRSGGSSMGTTIRSRDGSVKAATPSGTKPPKRLVCSNSECVLYRMIGIGKLISCLRSDEIFWYPLSA